MTISLEQIKMEKNKPSIIVDNEGVIITINQAFEKAFGWQISDLEQKALTLIIPNEMQDAHTMGFSRYLVSETSHILNQTLSLKIKTKDGAVVDADHYIIAEKQGAHYLFGAFITKTE